MSDAPDPAALGASVAPAAPTEKGERIAKRLARAGLCSRREAERWIAAGRVSVDGQVLTTPAVLVNAASAIAVDGKPVAAPESTRLWRYHKPAGLMTTHRDPQGRPTLFERLPKGLPRVVSIGRLDLNSEGLILLTNDGALARHLELPDTGWTRRYRVRVHGLVDPARLAALARGVTIAGIRYAGIEAALDKVQGSNAWLTMAVREGKNREIRKVCEHLDLQVTRLIRVSYGPFQLGQLARGAAEEVPRKVLREQLGAFFQRPAPAGRPAAPARPGVPEAAADADAHRRG
jgi:23S rRNA pseudouridine2605 synthase